MKIGDSAVEQPAMTSFIDIVFQLLIFFMLSLQLSEVSFEEIRLPQSDRPDKTKYPAA